MAEPTRREIKIGLLDELVCRGRTTVRVINGRDPAVLIDGPTDAVSRVRLRYRSMRLVVSLASWTTPFDDPDRRVVVTIVTDSLSRATSQGAAHVVFGEGATAPFTTGELRVMTSSSRATIGVVSLASLDVRLRGTGDVDLTGDVASLEAHLQGTGSLRCAGLVAQRADVRLNGIGGAEIMALDELRATVNGIGSVRFRGDPVVERRGSGLGRVEPITDI